MQHGFLLCMAWLCHMAAARSASYVWYTDPNTGVLYRSSGPDALLFPHPTSQVVRRDMQAVSQRIDDDRQQRRMTWTRSDLPQSQNVDTRRDTVKSTYGYGIPSGYVSVSQRSQMAQRPTMETQQQQTRPNVNRGMPMNMNPTSSRPWDNNGIRQTKTEGERVRQNDNGGMKMEMNPGRVSSNDNGFKGTKKEPERARPTASKGGPMQVNPVQTKPNVIGGSGTPIKQRPNITEEAVDEVPFDDYWLEDDRKDQLEMELQENALVSGSAVQNQGGKQDGGDDSDSAGPSRCVWAIVTCCKPRTADVPAIRYSCFEAVGCVGAFWDSHPCSRHMMEAALQATSKFYNKQQNN